MTQNKKTPIKPPVCYYGGKIRMSRKIVSLIPKHTLYCEPFCWWAAVFFKKSPSEIEVLNDHDAFIVNFYQVLQDSVKVQGLIASLDKTPYSRQQLQLANHIYTHQEHYGKIAKARAFWMLCNLSFSANIGGGYKFSKKSNKNVKAFHRKKELITPELIERLNNVDLECRDALLVIKSRDTVDSFFYVDPPYIVNLWENVNQGHYAGYTFADYAQLLEVLSTIKGKFLLSNYPSEVLTRFVKGNGWYYMEQKSKITANNASGSNTRRDKTEVLVANYPLDDLEARLKNF